MKKNQHKRHLIENEMVFREYNESIQKQFDSVKHIAEEDGQAEYGRLDDTPLHFYCECADENCQKRIILPPSHYARIHARRNRFIVLPGHESEDIEDVVHADQAYLVVEKVEMPDEVPRHLHETEIQNV